MLEGTWQDTESWQCPETWLTNADPDRTAPTQRAQAAKCGEFIQIFVPTRTPDEATPGVAPSGRSMQLTSWTRARGPAVLSVCGTIGGCGHMSNAGLDFLLATWCLEAQLQYSKLSA